MKILVISAVFPPEPVTSAKLSFDIANSISKTENVCVISPKPSRPLGFEFKDSSVKYDFEQIKMNSFTCPRSNLPGRFMESYSFGRYCYKYISENHQNIKLIYANTWPFIAQYFTIKAAKRHKIPLILHIQDVYPESLTNKLSFGRSMIAKFLIPIDKYILRNANCIITISEKMKDYLVKTRAIKSERVVVVPNWQDETVFIEHKKKSKPKNNGSLPFTFMYLGNIGPVAGLDFIIDSFAHANIKKSRLVIAGSGSLKKILKRKTAILKNVNIEFWSVPDGKVPEIQSFADVLLLPIKKGAALSSIPSKLPGYMFSGRPIIASVEQNSDTADVINNSQCGWVIEPENQELMVKSFRDVMKKSKEELNSIGERGFYFALKNLSKATNLQKVLKCISEL